MGLKVTWGCEAPRVTAGERSDTETVTLREARGNWRRATARWYLASCLLNFEYPLSNKVVNSNVCNSIAICQS
jgi:hypothetical protein